jgi:hypothetical protein
MIQCNGMNENSVCDGMLASVVLYSYSAKFSRALSTVIPLEKQQARVARCLFWVHAR